MKKELFDEMQTQKRNQIGNQSFSLLVILLMLDTLLYNLGIRWIEYPINVFIIVTVCCGIFVVRTAFHNALVSPKHKPGKTIVLILTVTILSMAAAIGLGKLIHPGELANKGSDVGTILLEVISWGTLIAAAAIYFIKRHLENKSTE